MEYRDIIKSLNSEFITAQDGVKLRLIPFTIHNNQQALRMMSGSTMSGSSASSTAEFKQKPAGRLTLPIVFIPGWISHLRSWFNFLPVLAQNADVYYFETREKPGSQINNNIYRQKGSFTIERHSEDLALLIRHLGFKNGNFYLAGPSMGANIILRYLSKGNIFPKAAAMLLPNPNFKIPLWGIPSLYLPSWFFYIIKPLIKSYLYLFKSDKDKQKSMLHYIFYGLDSAEPKRLRASAKYIQQYRLSDRLKEIKTPSLLVGSILDRMHLSSVVRELSSKIPHGEYMEIAVSGETHSKGMAQKLTDYFKHYE